MLVDRDEDEARLGHLQPLAARLARAPRPRSSIVIEVVPSRTSSAWIDTRSPTCTGRWKVIPSTATVATRPARPRPRQHRGAEVHLRHQPAAEDVAVGVGVRRHRDGLQRQRPALGQLRPSLPPAGSRGDVCKAPGRWSIPGPRGQPRCASAGPHGLRRYRLHHPPARARGRRRHPRGLRPRRLRRSAPSPTPRRSPRPTSSPTRSSPAASRAAFPDIPVVTEEQADEPRLRGAGLLPRRPARRHQGVRAAPRRLHRQHRADRERRADPRRRLRAGAGPALLHRRRRPLAGGGRAARRRSRAR